MMKSGLMTLIVLLLAATPALAQEQAAHADPESEALAKEAQQAVLEHCAAAAGRDLRPAAESVEALADVWARVNVRVEASRTVPLRYWRGVLAQCLHQEARAAEDLDTFIKAQKGGARWTELVADAEQRMGRLKRQEQAPGPVDPGWFVGGGLAAGAALFAVGAAVSWQQGGQTATEEIYPDGASGTVFEASLAKAESQSNASAVITGVAVGCGVGSIVSFVLTALRSNSAKTTRLQPPVLVPTRTGAAVTWEARW